MSGLNGNSFESLKLKLYKIISPILMAFMIVGWYLEQQTAGYDPVNNFMIPGLISLFLISTAVVYLREQWVPYLERVVLLIMCVLSALKFTYVVYNELEYTMTLGKFVFWLPLFYIFLFFVFDNKFAISFSALTFLWVLISGLIKLPDLMGTEAAGILVHYYLAGLTFLLTLFYLQTIKKAFIRSEVLEALANTDYLTSLPNRRKMDNIIMEALNKKHQDKKRKTALIYLDIDYFKKINDQYGHSAGDHVLKEFSEIIQTFLKADDVLGRWGGEEFIIVSNKKDINQASLLAEEIRSSVSTHFFEHVGHITCSFGVTEIREDDTLDRALSRADSSLYMAKHNGRNQVISDSKQILSM